MKTNRDIVLLFSLILAIAKSAVPQSEHKIEIQAIANMREDLLASFQAESKRGASFFYTQMYKVHGKHVEFHGSLYGVIEEAQVNECELKIRSEIVDLYTGAIGENLPRRTQSKYVSSLRFRLTAKIAEDLKVVTARPVRQLSLESNAVCSDSQQCNLTWIKLKAPTRVIHLTEITNDVAGYDGDVQDFDGAVDQLFLPVSSAEAGNVMIDKMRAYAQSCAD